MTRDFEAILAGSGAPLVVAHDQDAFFGGLYRSLLLRKTVGAPAGPARG
jgi:hypothetical protein